MNIAERKKLLDRDAELLKQEIALRQQIMPLMAKEDYATYVEYVHQGQYKHGKHTRLICESLQDIYEGKLRRLMLLLPPGHSKSQSVSETYPSWYIGNDPDSRVILTSYGDDLATDFGYKNLQKAQDFGKSLFGYEVDVDKQAKSDWGVKGKNGYMLSKGILSPITGKRAKLLLIDDPVKNDEEAASETIRERIWKAYQGTVLTRLLPNGAIILIMTRWHEDDLAGRILKNEKGWKVIHLPCEAEENDTLGRKVGEPLWPEFGYNAEWMQDQKTRVGSRVWNALYQGRPSSETGNVLKRNWWKYYNILPQMATKIISVDATFKDKETSDFVSIQVWGKTGPNMYMIDHVKARMDFPATLQAIVNMKAKHKDAMQILIEDKANGSAIIQVLRTKIGGVIAVEPQGGKVARVNAVSPQIESGNVYLPIDAEWVQDFVEECAAFPNGKHDDSVDSMSQALARLIYMYAGLPEAKEERDTFLHREQQQDIFQCEITDSFAQYGT